MRNAFAAINPIRRAVKFLGFMARTEVASTGLYKGASYTEVPAGWPNRATRRAVKQNRMNRLSGEWRQVLAADPRLVQAIRVL